MTELMSKFLTDNRDKQKEAIVNDIVKSQLNKGLVFHKSLFNPLEYGDTYEDIHNRLKSLAENYTNEFSIEDKRTIEDLKALIRFKLLRVQAEVLELIECVDLQLEDSNISKEQKVKKAQKNKGAKLVSDNNFKLCNIVNPTPAKAPVPIFNKTAKEMVEILLELPKEKITNVLIDNNILDQSDMPSSITLNSGIIYTQTNKNRL